MLRNWFRVSKGVPVSSIAGLARAWLGGGTDARASSPLQFSSDDLCVLDGYYAKMFAVLEDVHRAALRDMADRGCKTVLEVACGTGWCAPLAGEVGLDYIGLDISETAVAGALLKYPTFCFLNLPVHRCELLNEKAFDAVYSSSMLEHIGRVEEAIGAMWRLSRRRLDLAFYEGLTDAPEHSFRFVPYERSEPPRAWGGRYGMKVALQDHGPRDGRSGKTAVPGYFLNQFSRARLHESLRSLPQASHVEMRDFDGPLRSWVTVYRA